MENIQLNILDKVEEEKSALKFDNEEFTDYANKYKEASDKILKAKLAIDELREIQKRIKNLNIKFLANS